MTPRNTARLAQALILAAFVGLAVLLVAPLTQRLVRLLVSQG